MPSPKKKSPKPPSKKAEPAAAPEEAAAATATPSFKVGSKVSHPMFGDGVVTAVNGDRLAIKFKGDQERLIVAGFVKAR
jgi:hypothetical protein